VACGGQAEENTYLIVDVAEPTPSPSPTPEPLSILPPHFIAVEGVIIDVEGPVDENGVVPWYVDWFRIDIEKEDGSPAAIIGVHQTAFLFGTMPVAGMAVKAYIPANSPSFTADVPAYIASVIIAGMPAEQDVTVCWFRQQGDTYVNVDGSFAFMVDDETEIAFLDVQLAQWSANRLWFNLADKAVAVVHEAMADGTVTAIRAVALYYDLPLSRWVFWDYDDLPDHITLTVTDYIFPAADFETIHLPIFANGIKIEGPFPLLAADGITIMVPFRPIFMAGIGFGNYAMLQPDGGLRFGGGGAGSENSHWKVGRASVSGIGWSRPLDTPPIIVGGVIYVSLASMRSAPFVRTWLFEDRIDIYIEYFLPYGPWLPFDWDEHPMTPEEVAALAVVVDGTIKPITPAVSSREHFQIMLPIEPFAQIMGDSVQWLNVHETLGHPMLRAEYAYFVIDAYGEVVFMIFQHEYLGDELYMPLSPYLWWLGFNFIVYDGQILIIEAQGV